MPRATRTFDTDLAELSYQIARSEAFERIRRELADGRLDDQEAQERISDLIDAGHCRFFGDHGPEEWAWKLTEHEMGQIIGQLYRQLGAE